VQLTEKGSNDPIFKDLDSEFIIFQLHGETVELTSDMNLLGIGKYCKNQIVKYGNNAYGFQGHIELSKDMFYNWIIEDDNLKKLDYTSLDFDYKNLKIKYEEIGNRIFKNFLKIADFKIKKNISNK
jgi:GMP synthase-like glutamine amidotransferase